MYNYVLLTNRQGKTRLAKWYQPYSAKEKARITREVFQMIINRSAKHCNVLEYREEKIVYRRYASLFFVIGLDNTENELLAMEVLHHFVETLDRYFGNVCELDLIFNFHKAYFILDELILAGKLQETSKKQILRMVMQADILQSDPTVGDGVEF